MPESRKPDEPLVVAATGLDEAGQGVAASAGRTFHVADLLPGEQAEVARIHASPHKPEEWARIVRRVGDRSPDRQLPPCRAWGQCGGCAWQHLAYPAQLREKRARVVAALADAGLVEAASQVAAAIPSPVTLGYRNKGKYVAGAAKDGRLVLGAWAPRSHVLVDTSGCRVVAPVIDELRERARGAAEREGLAPWDERAKRGELRYVIVRATRDADPASTDAARALVVLVVRSDARAEVVERVARTIAEDPRVVGVLRMDNDRDDGALLDGDARVLVGASSLRAVLAGVDVDVGAGEFAQVNPAQADAMYARVATLVGGAARVADVYAGLGGITFALARAGASVVAIERDARAIDALRAAAARVGLGDRVDARAGDATMLGELRDLDAIVVNPPRKGLARDVVDAILASSARRLVYVSCGPESLGRDLALLRAGGFTIETIEPYDLMPGTAQIETIVALDRASPSNLH